jgi:hypothetical protein
LSIEEILSRHLEFRQDILGTEWQLWEHKTLNIHRGVLHWRSENREPVLSQMSQNIREQVESRFRIGWWRGFAFGVLIEAPAVPPDLSAIEDWIDVRANGKGTWQWIIYVCPKAGIAVGVHTWLEGYLSPVYQSLLASYQAQNYAVGSCKKDKGMLMEFLTTVRSLKRYGFKEFEP